MWALPEPAADGLIRRDGGHVYLRALWDIASARGYTYIIIGSHAGCTRSPRLPPVTQLDMLCLLHALPSQLASSSWPVACSG